MKYGVAFSLVAATLCFYAVRSGSALLLLLWPAMSFGLVAVAYFISEPAVFGKRQDGSMSKGNMLLLLPYLLYLWSVWHVARLLSREDAINTLDSDVIIGRRLLPSELTFSPGTIVDLTCEFPEPPAIRSSGQYISFPILDASAAASETIAEFAETLSGLESPVFIHCAQGHGRTALIASALLLSRGLASDADDALKKVQNARPLARPNAFQANTLRAAAERHQGSS